MFEHTEAKKEERKNMLSSSRKTNQKVTIHKG